MMNCPKCRVEMLGLALLGVEIEVCPLCNGSWLDKDELRQITRSRGKNAVAVKVVSKRPTQFRCPRCRVPLEEGSHVNDPDFLIDECGECGGIWLDRGELTRLISRSEG